MNANAPLERLEEQRLAYESAWASLQRLEIARLIAPLVFFGSAFLGGRALFDKPFSVAGLIVGALLAYTSDFRRSNFACPRCRERFFLPSDRSIGRGFGANRCAHCELERDAAFVPEPGGYRVPGRWEPNASPSSSSSCDRAPPFRQRDPRRPRAR